MFLLQGLALTGVGVVVGLVAAAGLGQLMSSVLFGVEPMDPASYLAAVGVIVAAFGTRELCAGAARGGNRSDRDA
jgi:hypothetical protein